MSPATGLRQTVACSAGQHVTYSRCQTDFMALGDIKRLNPLAGTHQSPDDLALVPEPGEIPFVRSQGAMDTDEAGFGHPDAGNARQDSQVASKAKSSGMGKTLAVAEQKIRGPAQLLQAGQEGGYFAKGQQPWNIREDSGAECQGLFNELELGKGQDHHGRAGQGTAGLKTDVQAGHPSDFSEFVLARYQVTKLLLNGAGLWDLGRPGSITNPFSQSPPGLAHVVLRVAQVGRVGEDRPSYRIPVQGEE